MKKSFSIFLILTFLFNTAGYLLIFLVLQSLLKNKAEEIFSANNLNPDKVIIAFANSDLQKGIPELKFFDDKEFLFKGKMYDIYEKAVTGDSTFFYCKADYEEDKLNLVFNETVENNSAHSQNNNVKNILLKKTIEEGLLFVTVINLIPQYECSFNINSEKIIYYVILRVLTPPPDLLSV